MTTPPIVTLPKFHLSFWCPSVCGRGHGVCVNHFIYYILSWFSFDFVFIWSRHTIVNNTKEILLFFFIRYSTINNKLAYLSNLFLLRFVVACQCEARKRIDSSWKMLYELTVITLIILCLWVIGRLLMMFDLVHLPKKRIHSWRHVKHANQVNFVAPFSRT